MSESSDEQQISESIQVDEEIITQAPDIIDPTRFSCLISFKSNNINLFDRCILKEHLIKIQLNILYLQISIFHQQSFNIHHLQSNFE